MAAAITTTKETLKLKKPPARKSSKKKISKSNKQAGVLLTNRDQMIAEMAYYKAEQRGFTPGFEEHDWLDAEKEIDAGLMRKELK